MRINFAAIVPQPLKCLFGFHEPGHVEARVGGRNVQRCIHCKTEVREYQVTKGQAQGERPKIRRIR